MQGVQAKQVKFFCDVCRCMARRPGRSHLYNLRCGPVVLDLTDLHTEYCEGCRKSYSTPKLMRVTIRKILRKVLATQPAMPKPVLRLIATKVAGQLSRLA